MIALFAMAVTGGLIFTVLLLLTLPEDVKRRTHRPMYLVLFALGFWFISYFALAAPGTATNYSYPSYNVIMNSSNTMLQANIVYQYPMYNVTSQEVAVPSRTVNGYLFFWLAIITVHFFLLLFVYIEVFRKNALKAAEEAAHALEGQ